MSSLTPGLKYDSTLGALYIGNVGVAIMFGVTSVQAYYYFSHYSDDKRMLKVAIAVLWVVDFLHMFCVCHGVYYYSVTNYTNPSALLSMPWSFNLQYLVETTNDVLIRIVLAYRLWHLSNKNKYICGFILGCTSIVLALAIFCFVSGIEYKDFDAFRDHTQWAFYTIMSLMIVSDIVIATSLCKYLTRNSTELIKMRSAVQKLLFYTVNTTALTCATVLVCVITFVAKPSTFIFMAIIFIKPKLYLNSLLGQLNSRKKLRSQIDNEGAVSIPLGIAAARNTPGLPEDTKNENFERKSANIQFAIGLGTA